MAFELISLNVLESISEALEESCPDFDVSYSDGILSIKAQNGKELVVNKHSASQKIWFSSPVSGAKYFIYDPETSQFTCQKTNVTLMSSIQNDLFAM